MIIPMIFLTVPPHTPLALVGGYIDIYLFMYKRLLRDRSRERERDFVLVGGGGGGGRMIPTGLTPALVVVVAIARAVKDEADWYQEK